MSEKPPEATAEPTTAVRKRDPQRKSALLDAAARLVAERGFAGVSMAEIGAEVGVAASAIYWHFPSKQALLVELFDQCLDRLRAEQIEAVGRCGVNRRGLREIGRLQVAFVVRERAFARVYYAEMRNLPPADLSRLRAKQRDYVVTWVDVLQAVRPELENDRAEGLVHAAIGAVQSALVYRSPFPSSELELSLEQVIDQVLATPGSASSRT